MTDSQHFPLGDNIGSIELVSKHQDPLLSVVNAARVSYNTEKVVADEKDQKLAKFLWNHNHSSPFRHAFYTFKIKAPLCVMRQWWKHQVGAPWVTVETEDGQSVNIDISAMFIDSDGSPSWNELSGRYVEFSDEFYIPKAVRSNAGHANKQVTSEVSSWTDVQHAQARVYFQEATLDAFRNYEKALEMGYGRELARMLLPQNIYTSAVWTPSLQALTHFLQLRLKEDAQWEIRQYAVAIKAMIQDDLDQLGIEL